MKSRRKKEIKHDNGCYQNDRIFIQKQRPGKGVWKDGKPPMNSRKSSRS